MATKKTKKNPVLSSILSFSPTQEELWAHSINRRVRHIESQIEELEDMIDNATPSESRHLYEAARSIGRVAQRMMREASGG